MAFHEVLLSCEHPGFGFSFGIFQDYVLILFTGVTALFSIVPFSGKLVGLV